MASATTSTSATRLAAHQSPDTAGYVRRRSACDARLLDVGSRTTCPAALCCVQLNWTVRVGVNCAEIAALHRDDVAGEHPVEEEDCDGTVVHGEKGASERASEAGRARGEETRVVLWCSSER